jgi:hypothetical protein
MEADFPATESDDAHWFAIDADGHVASFYPDQSGAIPVKAMVRDRQQLAQRLMDSLPRCEAIFDLRGHLRPGLHRKGGEHWLANHGYDHGALMFLASLEPVKRQISSGQAVPVSATSGVAVIFRRLPTDVTQRLHKHGHCLGCFYHYVTDFRPIGEQVRPAHLGLYSYNHPKEDWVAAPYHREMLPRQPVHIDQLPPDFRALVGRVRFGGLCFAQTVYIQPCETQDVACWEPAYLSADGKAIRPIIGNFLSSEMPYAEFYELMTGKKWGWLKGITIEPPPGGEPKQPCHTHRRGKRCS